MVLQGGLVFLPGSRKNFSNRNVLETFFGSQGLNAAHKRRLGGLTATEFRDVVGFRTWHPKSLAQLIGAGIN